MSKLGRTVVTPSPEEVMKCRTQRGAWTAKQLALWGIDWPPPRGWKKQLKIQWESQRGITNETVCEVCGIRTEKITITDGMNDEGILNVHVFCCTKHAAFGGYPWAGK